MHSGRPYSSVVAVAYEMVVVAERDVVPFLGLRLNHTYHDGLTCVTSVELVAVA